jgi:pseudouridine synthase
VERLNKVLAHAGIASRRAADALIRSGRVEVNGSVVRELGARVDPARDAVRVDGRRIRPVPRAHSYWMLNKPAGYVTTLSDPQGRPTIVDLLRGIRSRVFPVGRLDWSTEGLLLLTDDGELGRDLMHPGRRVPKTYAVKVRGAPDEPALRRLREGVRLDGRRTLPAAVRLARPGANCWLEITIHEGRQRQVRRMFQALGHPVQKLRRVGYAGLALGRLPSGGLRALTPAEVDRLRRAARGDEREHRS